MELLSLGYGSRANRPRGAEVPAPAPLTGGKNVAKYERLRI